MVLLYLNFSIVLYIILCARLQLFRVKFQGTNING